VLVLVVFISMAYGAEDHFKEFLTKYKKHYEPEEYERRKEIFENNLNYIKQHNEENGVRFSINEHADKHISELVSRRRTFVSPQPSTVPNSFPDNWNWEKHGVVGPVQNQGSEGGDEIPFVDAVASCHALTGKSYSALSSQQVADCYHGGDSDYWKYILSAPGLDSAVCYPPSAGGRCKFQQSCCITSVQAVGRVIPGNETNLQESVLMTPVAVTVDASHTSFQLYGGGIYYESRCSSSNLDHEMLAVGWGVNSGGSEYWIVQNSWGESWGIQGYIYMARNRNNNCGIATFASYPIGCGPCNTQ